MSPKDKKCDCLIGITTVSLLIRVKFTQNLHPVNFPDFPYNEEEIRQPADFGKFVKQKRERAMQATKAGQSTR